MVKGGIKNELKKIILIQNIIYAAPVTVFAAASERGRGGSVVLLVIVT